MDSNNNQLSVPSSAEVTSAKSSSSAFVSTVAQEIVNQQFTYPNDFISNVNLKTGVLKQTIHSISMSLHHPRNLSMIEDILNILVASMLSYDPNSGKSIVSKFRQLLLRVTKPSMKHVWEDMDQLLMPNLNCGKKQFNMYSIPWQIKLKNIVVYAIAYNLDICLTSLKN